MNEETSVSIWSCYFVGRLSLYQRVFHASFLILNFFFMYLYSGGRIFKKFLKKVNSVSNESTNNPRGREFDSACRCEGLINVRSINIFVSAHRA